MKYIVLFPISLDSGPIIRPAADGMPPVIVDDTVLFETPSEFFTNEERAKILMNMGAIIPVDAPDEALSNKRATQSLKTIT